MAEYKEPKRKALAELIDGTLGFEPEGMLRSDLGAFGFDKAAEDVDRIRRLLLRLSACDLSLITDNRLQDCTRFVSEARDVFIRMRQFSFSTATTAPASERNVIMEQCTRVWNSANDLLLGVFAIASPTLQETDHQVRILLERARADTDEALKAITSETEKARHEIELTLESVRAATGAIGVEKQAEIFKNAASEHAKGRGRWLWVTGILSVFTLAALIGNWVAGYMLGPPPGSIALVHLAIAKVLVFSFLLSAVVWSGRIYRSHQHNYVINKHRQDALETFQLFARAADDPETKAMVLIQATKSIFAPQPTGFLPGEKDSDGTSPQVLEIVRGLATTAK